MNSYKEKILTLIKENESTILIKDVEEAFNLNNIRARLLLEKMRDRSDINKVVIAGARIFYI